ncbi:MAG: response regulator [Blautia sp.]|nr:response regulator [Blautia sp.]
MATFHSYSSYLDELIYQERLNQMIEVTEELYSSMDMLMQNEWETAQLIKDSIISEHIGTVGQLTGFLKKLQDIFEAGTNKLMPIAIDGNGRYYSASGKKGVIYNIEELVDCEERMSSVINIFGTNSTEILFIYKLDEPVLLEDTAICYCGYIKDLSDIIDCYHTDAFSGQSTAYVMNRTGTKLYSTDSEQNNQVFVGRNIFSILEDMTYAHGNSYESLINELEESGNSIANASQEGTEYYLCLHHMADTDWVLLLAIPAQYVATNTQILVGSVVKTLVFAGIILAVIFIIILVILLRMRQQEQLYRKEQENNAKLEVSRRLAEESKHAAEEAFKVAEAANNSKSSFLSNMSHDIRTPMNAIVGFSDLLERDADDPKKVREYTRKIKLSGQHLLGLINDVLDMSKIESGNTTLNLSDEKIADIIDEVETIIRPQMQEKGHTFDVVTHDIQHENIVVDKLRLNQILLNLLSNACKYTPDGGHVILSVTELPQRRPQFVNLHFSVQDNGYGMTEEYAEIIFDTFTREENSVTNKVQGTGLGMAITKSLVKLMGGRISLQTEKGKGSVFHVNLELHISDAADNKYFWEQNNISKILVVDDSEKECKDIVLSMERCGVQVRCALSGEDAVKIAAKDKDFDVVIIEWYMKGMSGKQTATELRKLIKKESLFILLSSYNLNDTLTKTDEIPADGLLPKPFFVSKLRTTLDGLLNGHEKTGDIEEINVLNGLHFLAAEDNELNAEILKEILKNAGATVDIYENGKLVVDAFEKSSPGRYAAVFMDVQMPVMNGLEATKAIRSSIHPLSVTIPIIAMTANAFSEDIHNCLEAGMNAHVSKPIDIIDLEKTVQRALRLES